MRANMRASTDLPEPELTDDGQHFAGAQRNAHAVDGDRVALGGEETLSGSYTERATEFLSLEQHVTSANITHRDSPVPSARLVNATGTADVVDSVVKPAGHHPSTPSISDSTGSSTAQRSIA
jgi:hypothetical protein